MAGSIGAISLSGDKQLQRKLQRISDYVETKLSRDALKQAAAPIIKAAKANIATKGASRKRKREFNIGGKPVSGTGNLRKSIGYRMKTYKTSGVLVLVLGPRWPLGAHGHLVEFGTQARFTADGVFRGIGPAKPFLRPAWDANIGQAKRIIQSVARLGILKQGAGG